MIITTTLFLYICVLNFNYISHYKFFYKQVKLLINDSLAYIYILSSPQYTIILYVVFVMYNYILHKRCGTSRGSGRELLLVFLFIYFYYVNFFYLYSYVTFKLKQQMTNTSLQNGLLNFHPFYVYFIYGVITLLLLTNYYNAVIYFSASLNNLKKWLVYILLSIFLGGFWAAQEFNWGSFWSWDPVELVSLLLLFYLSVQYHNKHRSFSVHQSFIKTMYAFLLIYFIIRLGLLTSVHSFILNSKILTNTTWIITLTTPVILINAGREYNFRKFLMRINFYHHVVRYSFNATILTLIIVHLSCSILFIVFYKFSFFLYPVLYITGIKLQDLIRAVIIIYVFNIFFINFNSSSKAVGRTIVGVCTVIIICVCFSTVFLFHNSLIFMIVFTSMLLTHTFKYRTAHLILLFFYCVFVIFFININIYFSKQFYCAKLICLNKNYQFIARDVFYEIAVNLRKNFFFEKLKAIYKHIKGFSVYNNFFISFYILHKGQLVTSLYGHIYLFIAVYLFTIMLAVIFVYDSPVIKRVVKRY